jgi:hypothetical protein
MYVDLAINHCKLSIRRGPAFARVSAQEEFIMRALWLYTIAAGLVCTALTVSAQAPSAGAARQQGDTTRQQGDKSGGIGGNIARGQYIAEHVAMCVECHSPRDENGTIVQGREYTGAPLPINPLPGWATRAPRNRGLLGYGDEQAMRLLTQGAIGRQNEQLMLPMPRFRMNKEDAADVIAFLRSLH